MPSLSWRKMLVFSFFILLLFYVLIEISFSILYINGFIYPASAFLFEDSGRTIHFDPIRGFTLTPIPSRFARITYGNLEYIGTFQGNSSGFPDRDDFFPERDYPEQMRFAVFGDSFTSAQFIEKNWPDLVEDLSHESDKSPIQLLNFSVDGGGLANWWNILFHIVKEEHFQIDGLIFVVFGHDLQRGFSIAEHRGYPKPMFGRLSSWNPAEWPKTLEEAHSILTPLEGDIVSPEQFQQALEDRQLPRAWRPYFSMKILNRIQLLFTQIQSFLQEDSSTNQVADESQEPSVEKLFSLEQIKMIREIRDFARSSSLPIIVVRVPKKQELFEQLPPREDILAFATQLEAAFVDGLDAFAGLTKAERETQYFPYDGHWNQIGSDRFAHFMFENLQLYRR